jgi:hypothetical protein
VDDVRSEDEFQGAGDRPIRRAVATCLLAAVVNGAMTDDDDDSKVQGRHGSQDQRLGTWESLRLSKCTAGCEEGRFAPAQLPLPSRLIVVVLFPGATSRWRSVVCHVIKCCIPNLNREVAAAPATVIPRYTRCDEDS